MASIISKSKLYLFLFFSVLITSGCNTGEKNYNRIIIKGTVDSPATGKIFFYTYPDTLAIYSEIKILTDTSTVDSKGRFSFDIPADHPLTFNLEDGKNELATNLFAYPGDVMELDITGKDHKLNFKINTPAGKFNSYLNAFLDTFYRNPPTKREYYIATNYMDGASFVNYNDRRKQTQLDFLESYFRKNEFRKEYKDYALNTIQYGIAVDRLMYVWKKRMKNEKVVIDSNYFDFETPAFIENSDAYSSPSYIRFLNLYIKDTYERMVERGEFVSIPERPLIPSVEKYKLAVTLLNRPYRDAVLYYIISGDMNDVTSKSVSHFDSKIPVDTLVKWFKEKYSLD